MAANTLASYHTTMKRGREAELLVEPETAQRCEVIYVIFVSPQFATAVELRKYYENIYYL